MKWILKLFDTAYRNLYSFFVCVISFIVLIIFVSISSQYIGEQLGQKLLNNKSISMFVFLNKNEEDNKDLKKFIKKIDSDANLKQFSIKTKKFEIKENNKLGNKTAIIVSKDEQFMEKLAENRVLSVLDRGMFSNSLKQNVQFSKYDEYAIVATNYNNIKIYIGYINKEKNGDKNKIYSVFGALNAMVFKHDVEDPNEENWFPERNNPYLHK